MSEAGPGEGEAEVPTGPTHEPFSFKLLSVVSAQQNLNGLRHNDHLRYRQYCARRLRRLYNVLKFKHGRGRFKQVPFPDDFQDVRFLEVPLVNAERAWSFAVQLKADSASAAAVVPRWRHHSIQRLAKGVKWAQMLESVCKVHADQRTQLEAEAYAAFLEGSLAVEKENWSEGLAKLKRYRQVCEHLALVSDQSESTLFKERVQDMAPMLRECKYNLGMDQESGDEQAAAKPKAAATKKDLSELSYRGNGLAIPSDKIKDKLMKCIELTRNIKVSDDSEAVIDQYGALSTDFGDALHDIHTDMLAAGSGGQSSDWRMLEAFARELSVSMNVERNLMLLRNHFVKLDKLQEVTSSEARKVCRPEEGMRFCDLLKEDIENLQDLPETTDDISTALSAYVAIVVNCRCLFLALCHMSLGKVLEAAALMDMLNARVGDPVVGKKLAEPLGRLHPLFERVQQSLPAHVSRWRCRGLSQLCIADTGKGKKAVGEAAQSAEKPVEDLGTFPPKFRDVPCKPLLCDLAFQCILPPDFDELLPKEGDKKGLLGKLGGVGSKLGGVAGGLGSKLGGLWGRK